MLADTLVILVEGRPSELRRPPPGIDPRWSDVIAELDYDIRRIWVDGTPEDRAVFTLSHTGVVEHAARTTAYEQQVCSD